MAKTRVQKELTVKQLVEKLTGMTTVVYAQFGGLKVKEATALRKLLREQQIDFVIAKKSLLRRALTEAKLDPDLADRVDGSVALAFGYADEVLPAKTLQKFSKEHPAVVLAGGVVQGGWVDAAQVKALATLPSREELLAKTVWTIQAPLTGFANVLAGNIRSLINVLKALPTAPKA